MPKIRGKKERKVIGNAALGSKFRTNMNQAQCLTATVKEEVSVLSSLIDRQNNLNASLAHHIIRLTKVGDRLFGETLNTKDGGETPCSPGIVSALEHSIMETERLVSLMIDRISRLEIL